MIPLQLGKVLYTLTHGLSGAELHRAVGEFAALVQKEQLMNKMDYIIDAYTTFAKEQEGIVTLEITTARALSKKMLEALTNNFGTHVETSTQVDSDLIGGVVVKAGDTILDGSIKTQLMQMKRFAQ